MAYEAEVLSPLETQDSLETLAAALNARVGNMSKGNFSRVSA